MVDSKVYQDRILAGKELVTRYVLKDMNQESVNRADYGLVGHCYQRSCANLRGGFSTRDLSAVG